MARNEEIYLQGKTKWFRPKVVDTMFEPAWKHVLYPDTKSVDKIRELQAEGVKNVLKKDDDGYFINLKRPTSLKRQGKVVPLEPPLVFHGVDENGEPKIYHGDVGNGSDITDKMLVYTHKVPGPAGKTAKAMRWESTRIDNLIAFIRSRDFTEPQIKQSAGLEEQPEQLF